MFQYLYEWILNVSFYLIIVTAVIQVVPGNGYKKYIKFFSGLIMILLLLTPILKLTGMGKEFSSLYHSHEYEMEKEAIEEQQSYMEDLDIMDFLPEEYQTGESQNQEENQGTGSPKDKIEVEGVTIGE